MADTGVSLEMVGVRPRILIRILRRDKSFAYDLNVERGVVSSRVALLLRSAETKPVPTLFVLLTPPSIFVRFHYLSRLEGGLPIDTQTKRA